MALVIRNAVYLFESLRIAGFENGLYTSARLGVK